MTSPAQPPAEGVNVAPRASHAAAIAVPDRVPSVGSLFSGSGGLDLAVQHAFAARTVWHCELDRAASKVLAARWPGVPNLGDITAVDWSTIEPVEILCGGYPCQPFSAAGQRKGTADERHLWPYFAEAIRHLRPRFVVLENVAGHRSMGFNSVLADLAGIGYDAQWCSLRASDVGAPHRRERLFVVAHTAGDGWDEGRPESAGFVGGSDAAVGGVRPVELLPTPTSRDHKGANQRGDETCLTGALLPTPAASDGGRHPDARAGHTSQIIDVALLHGSTAWGKYEPAIRRWETLTRPAPSPTEPNTKGNPRLSSAFSEWMMGWPEGWVTDVPSISRNDALRIIGNGVVPPQALRALTWLLSISAVAA